LNKIGQQENFENAIKYENLKSSERYGVTVSFKNDTTIYTKQLFLLEDGFMHFYEVTKGGIQFKKAIPEASYSSDESILTFQYKRSGEELLVETLLDTIPKDTIAKPQFESFYKLDDYTGKLGCPFPIKENELSELKGIISSQNLEDNKLEKVREAIFDMDSACVMVEQTKELIVLFEYEETKLEFAKFMYPYTFDLDNYGKLNEIFQFENSMEELNLFIKHE
jgi:hypothetical protein